MYRLTLTNSNSPTVTDNPIEMFLNDIDVKPNTRDIYRKELKQFVEFLNRKEILQPTKQTIVDYKQQLIDEGKAPHTVLAYILVVKALYKWMNEQNICANITKGVKLPKINNRLQMKDALLVKDAKNLIRSAEGESQEQKRNKALISTLLHTGLRSIEIFRANIGDLQQRDGHWILMIQGKGSSFKDDFVVITEITLKPIQDYLSTRPEAKQSDPLFASISNRNDGGRLTTMMNDN